MDVLRLGEDFYVDKILEGFTSIIWTERFIEAGDFELRTPRIAEMMEELPYDSIISLADTQEMMIVEQRSIEKNDQGGAELVIKGRSFETFLQHRHWTSGRYGKKGRTRWQMTAAGVAEYILYNSVLNNTTKDLIRVSTTVNKSVADVIPNLELTHRAGLYPNTPNGTFKYRFIEPGDCYSQLLKFLNMGKVGVSTIRPPSYVENGEKEAYIFSNTVDFRTPASAFTSNARLHVYWGNYHSLEFGDDDPITFDYSAGHLTEAQYLYDSSKYKTIAFIDTDIGTTTTYRADEAGDPDITGATGLARRVLYVDGGQKDTDATEGGTNAEFLESVKDQAEAQLRRNYTRKEIFDGKVSPVIPYKFKEDYFLGDVVDVRGEYGFSKAMRVTEYIRTLDANGEQSYPTLSQVF
jgi:hypothetical protein